MTQRKIQRYDDGGDVTPVDTSSNNTGAGTGNYMGGSGNYGVDTSYNNNSVTNLSNITGIDPTELAIANAESSPSGGGGSNNGSGGGSGSSGKSGGALNFLSGTGPLLTAISGILSAAGHYKQAQAASQLPTMPTLPGGGGPLPSLPGQGGSTGFGPAGGYNYKNYANMTAGTPGLGYAPRTQSPAQPASSYYTYGAGPEQQFFQQVQPGGGPIAPVTHKHGGRITRKAHGGVARYDSGGTPELQTAQSAGIVPAPQQNAGNAFGQPGNSGTPLQNSPQNAGNAFGSLSGGPLGAGALQTANAQQQQAAPIPGASGAPGALPPGTPGAANAANATQQQAAQAPSAGFGGALGSMTPATANAPQQQATQAMPGAPTPSQQTPTSQVAPQAQNAQNIAPSVSSILGKPGIMGSMPSAGGAGMGGIIGGMMPRPGTPMPAASPAAGQMTPHPANPMENPARSGFAAQRPAWGRRTMMGRMADGGTPEPPPKSPFINSNGQFIPQISQGPAQSGIYASQSRGDIAANMPKRFMQPAPGHAHGGALSGMPAAPKPSRHIQGPGDGTSDDIPARLANGEYVLSADVVSGIGNGDNGSGARKLDQFVHNLRVHKAQNASKGELPADAKPLHQYLGR